MRDDLTDIYGLARDINILWKDIYPYLARHVADIYGRCGGTVIEVGPFCGVIHELKRQGIGDSFYIGSFPNQMKKYYAEETGAQGHAGSVAIIETGSHLNEFEDNSIDLAIFRGALFFPSLFTVDYHAIHRVLKPSGIAFIGGGFGKHTPLHVISPIADRSRKLNILMGKQEVTVEMITEELKENALMDCAAITTDGGLWIIMRKEDRA